MQLCIVSTTWTLRDFSEKGSTKNVKLNWLNGMTKGNVKRETLKFIKNSKFFENDVG